MCQMFSISQIDLNYKKKHLQLNPLYLPLFFYHLFLHSLNIYEIVILILKILIFLCLNLKISIINYEYLAPDNPKNL